MSDLSSEPFDVWHRITFGEQAPVKPDTKRAFLDGIKRGANLSRHSMASAIGVATEVLRERLGHLTKGYTTAHDDQHVNGELTVVAAELTLDPKSLGYVYLFDKTKIDRWGLCAKHKGDRRRQLVIAASLIISEIQRIDRHKRSAVES